MFTDAIMLYGLIESKGGWKAKGKKLLVFEYFSSRFNGRKDELFVKIWCAVIRAIFGVEKKNCIQEMLYPKRRENQCRCLYLSKSEAIKDIRIPKVKR